MKATPTSRDKQKGSRASERSRPKLTESAELAQSLLRCAETGVYIVQDGKFQYVNSLFQELTGYSEQELLGMYSLSLVHPEDRETVRKKAIESLKGGTSLSYDYRFARKNGEIIWALEKVTSTEYKGNRAAVGSFMDITERKQLEEELKKSEERYRALFENSIEAVFTVDIDGNFTSVNKAFEEWSGYSREEAIGMSYKRLVVPEHIDFIFKEYNKLFRTGQPLHNLVYECIVKDGERRLVEGYVNLLKKGDWIEGFQGTLRDITERKQLEQKLADMATHDFLTGLPNRILLHDRLVVGLAQAERNGTKLAVMMLDLDWFKTVNDTLGHGVGDQLLRAAGERLTGLVRKSDTVARMGGDEFVLLLSQIPKMEDATKIAQKILGAFRKPFVLDGHRLNITTSIGIAIYPEDGEDVEALLKNADTAMYWAKEQGRDNYELYWYDGTKTL